MNEGTNDQPDYIAAGYWAEPPASQRRANELRAVLDHLVCDGEQVVLPLATRSGRMR